MALQTESLKRQFKFKKSGNWITLEDPNIAYTPEEVLVHYSVQYPELTTATLDEPKIDGNKAIYEITTTVGDKG
jgi:PRTRC genetic system protein C